MGKRILIVTLCLVISVVIANGIFASEKGNGRKGKYLFRKNCRTCHSETGSAKELSPISKTQADWQAVFENDAFKNLSCGGEWKKRSEQDLLDIYAYMYDHAFDSPSPLKCK
jgi:hypothetical protein